MKKITLFTIISFLLCISVFSQIPQGFNYQAVLRDSDGKVKANANVSIEISLIQESIDGEAIYTEVHNTATNKFGLVNLVIGQGETTDDLSTINWAEDLFFIKITVDGTVMGTNQLLSVPFAMHAQTAGNTFSGNYNDLENQPDLSGYLTEETDGSITNELQVLTISNDTIFLSDGGFVKLPAGTSFSGSFNDLTDVPTGLSDGDDDTQLDETAVDAFVANNGYLTTEVDGSVTNEIELPTQTGNSGKMLTTDGSSPSWATVSYNDLTDVPANIDTDATDDFDGAYSSLSGAPTNVSTFTNDAGYLTTEVDGSITNEIELPTQTGNSGKVLSTDGSSPSWVTDDVLTESEVDTYVSNNGYLTTEVDGSITNEIELPTQTGNSGKMLTTDGSSPSWAAVSYNDLTDVPANIDTDATDDFDGAYSSLSGAPTNVSTFTNDAGYLTTEVDGSVTNEIELPTQTGHSGKYLTTDGSSVSWSTVSAGNSFTSITTNSGGSSSSNAILNYGRLLMLNTDNSAAQLRFQEPSGSGTSYISLESPAVSGNYQIKLPAADGTNGQVLKTDGSGQWGWTNASSFDGDFTNLTNIPSGLADGDDDTQLDETAVDAFVANNGYLTTEVDGSITNEIELPAQTGNSGKVLSTDGSSPSWVADDVLTESEVDTYVSNNGYLTTEVDGSVTNEIELPDQTGHSGKYLTTDGTSPSWGTPAGGSSNLTMQTISSNTTLGTETKVVYITGSYTVTLPASPATGQILYMSTDDRTAQINPNGNLLHDAGGDYGTSSFNDYGNWNVTLYFNGSKWYTLSAR